jgi:hypothetical protein
MLISLKDCIFLPMDRSLTYIEPKASDLVGKYVPTSGTLNFIKERGYPKANSFIELSTNGFFRMVSIPDCWQFDSKHTGRFDSGQGKWKVKKNNAVWDLRFDIESRNNFAIPHEAGLDLLSVSLQNQAPPYAIRFYVDGNPDSFATLVFEQILATNKE